MESKIYSIKTKSPFFKDWLQEVISTNKLDTIKDEILSAIFLWETTDEKGNPIVKAAHLNCDIEQYDWYYRSMGGHLQEWRFREFMRKHINDYIKYI